VYSTWAVPWSDVRRVSWLRSDRFVVLRASVRGAFRGGSHCAG